MAQAKKDTARTVLSFKIKPELKERLQKLADLDRRTLSGYIEIVLTDHADRVDGAPPESPDGDEDSSAEQMQSGETASAKDEMPKPKDGKA